jgi:drug/metabolite transporter (DMT)-like permease
VSAHVGSTPAQVRRAWLAWAAVCVIWGTTYLAVKVSLDTVPPFLMGGLRNVVGGTILGAWLVASGRALPPRSSWGRLAILGLFMFLVGNGGVVWGIQFIPSGLSAVLIGTSPFWMVGVEALVAPGAQFHARQWIGLVVGFLGILLLVWPDIAQGGMPGRHFALGVVSLQLACAGWAVGSSYTRRHVMPADVLGSAAMQMLFGGLFLCAAGTVAGEWGRVSFTARTGAAMVYLVLAGSVVAFAAYSYALRHMDVATVSLYTYINPVIAVALGTLVLGEPFHVRMLLAAALILGGTVIVGQRQALQNPKRPTTPT